MKTIVQDCIEHLKHEKNLSQNTLASYERDIRQFISFLLKNGVNDTQMADKSMIEKYIDCLKTSGKSPSTISRCAASIRMLYRFMIRNGKVSGNPIAGLETPRINTKMPDILSNQEVSSLLDQPGTSDPRSIRDRTILCLLYRTGMKVSELIAINVDDIDFSTGAALLGKNRKSRKIAINDVCLDNVRVYLKLSRPYLLKESSETALLINSNGKRLSRQGIWKILKKYSKLACPGREITPYTLRHTHAADMLKSGCNPADVQQVLGNITKSTIFKYRRLV